MKRLIITTLALGLSASAFAAYDPLQNEPGFYWEYLSDNNKADPTTNVQPEVGARSESMEVFESNRFSYERAESKNR